MKAAEIKPPSFEEVQSYAREAGLEERLNVKRFYDYYARTGFLFKGLPFNWQEKMHEWAATQWPRTASKPKPINQNFDYGPGFASKEQLDYIEKIAEGWGK